MIDESMISSLADAPSCLLDQVLPEGFPGAGELTRAMLITWLSRADLQRAFDLSLDAGRSGLAQWCRAEQGRKLPQKLFHKASLLSRRARAFGRSDKSSGGVNMVGYARGVLGMGEHVRMSAKAMRAAGLPSGLVDFTVGLGSRRQSLDIAVPRLRSAIYPCNLFHINADQMARAYWRLGPDFFAGRYNIGYWAWELANWPAEWLPAIATVDELWAPSRFIRDAFIAATRKPVRWMSLCVELPSVTKLPRSKFGASDEDFLFVFTFDCHSYLRRKNPGAIVRAFRAAFPASEQARLIIKTMNAEVCADDWQALISDAAGDERITLIDETWPRNRVLSLIECCDAYVSLHRSEGFGRGPAEAMLLGKPVIITNYSGTADFSREDNALLINYRLVGVRPGSYVGATGQVWAEPSIEDAARSMRALFDDRTLGPRIGDRGRRTISEEFGSAAIGRHYRARLHELNMIGSKNEGMQ